MDEEYAWRTAGELVTMIEVGETDPVEIAEQAIARVERLDPVLRLFTAFDAEQIRRDAVRLRDSGPRGPLHGVPFSIKELTEVAGLPHTQGLLSRRHVVSTRDAVIVERLKAAGGLFLGKTNAPPVGYTVGTWSPIKGQTENPWRPGRTPGGSSGGAAASVAAGISPLAEGGDGAGSVRIPAALCGLVGMKPSFGVIPQTIVSTLVVANVFHGPITRTVDDSARMLDAVAGPSDRDPLSAEASAQTFRSAVGLGADGLRIAWSDDLGTGQNGDPEVLAIGRAAMDALAALGARLVEGAPRWRHDLLDVMWRGLWVPSTAGMLELLDREQREYGSLEQEHLELVAEARRSMSKEAEGAKSLLADLWEDYADFMRGGIDVVASPTVLDPAFPYSQKVPDRLLGGGVREQLAWVLTYPFNMLASPAITVPAGFTSEGLPVGVQFAAMPRRDRTLYAVAGALESVASWRGRRPDLNVFGA